MHGFDFDSFYLNSKPFFKRYIKSSLNKSDKILVLSNYWKSFFDREFLNLPVEVLQNGIDVTLYRQCIKKSTEYSEFLFLGRLGERKGTYDLLDAVDVLVNSMGKKELKFYLAGDGEIEKVRKIINEKNLTNNVELLGWLNNDEKREMLKRTDVIILPSYEEGLPMSLIEAMACGKVIISTYAGGIPDLVEQDLNGFLFNAGDISKLVEYITFVNENPDRMAEIGQNNINKVNKSFNLETINKRLDSIYNKL
jgi:glycosyltransferase involved in cell wall biosynthesis